METIAILAERSYEETGEVITGYIAPKNAWRLGGVLSSWIILISPLSYGGYTSLDKVYLERVLAGLTEEQKLQFITPPPSVINAYFAELYQKKSPDAATDYYEQVTEVFDLYQTSPSFEEDKPFVRLNLWQGLWLLLPRKGISSSLCPASRSHQHGPLV